jgi:hypothetical protein
LPAHYRCGAVRFLRLTGPPYPFPNY